MLPFEAMVPAGLKAYNCVSVDGGVLTLAESAVLQANTPYLLSGTVGGYSFTGVPDVAGNDYTAGCMTGVHAATSINSGYVLQIQDGVTAFYRVDESTPVTVPAAHCYLNVSGTACLILLHKNT